MQRQWSRILALILGLPLVLSLLAACGTGTAPTSNQATKTIKIGSNFPVSGDDQSNGLPAQNGVEYAVEEANKQNFLSGYKFVLNHKDDVGPSGAHDSGVAAKNYRDLIDDAEMAGIIGPLNSSVAQAVMPNANQAPIAMISPANTNDCLTQNTPDYACAGSNELVPKLRPTGKVTYFRTATLDQYQGAALAEYAYKTLNYRKVFLIDDTETYGTGLTKTFKTSFEQFGGSVLDQRSVKKTNDYSNLLTAVAAAKPDFIFFGGTDATGGNTLRAQMNKIAGLEKTPYVVGDGTKTSQFAKDIIPLAGGPVYGAVPGVDSSQVSKAKTFLDGYQKKYGNAGAYSGGGYDDTWILLQAIKKVIQDKVNPPANSNDSAQAKTFRQAVIDALKKTDYDGVTGHHTFDTNGDTTNKAISIYTLGKVGVSDGWKYLTSVNPGSTTASPTGTSATPTSAGAGSTPTTSVVTGRAPAGY